MPHARPSYLRARSARLLKCSAMSPGWKCLLPRTEMAGATKGIDKHLLRCDIGRGRKSFSVSRCDVRGGDDVTRTAV